MLDNCESAAERWGGVNDIIDKWLQERKDLIVRFCDLSANQSESPEAKVERFQGFCQILVDYVSTGHFEVYEQLIREAAEYKDGSVEFANKIIPQIQKTTEAALTFNDQFDDIHKVDDGVAVLESNLESLGKTLEERFELEDVLIEELHKSHEDSVAE